MCDRFLFAKLLHTKGYLPYYAYILFFVLMFVATLIPRIGYRILRRYVHNLVGRRNGQKRIMIVGADLWATLSLTSCATITTGRDDR